MTDNTQPQNTKLKSAIHEIADSSEQKCKNCDTARNLELKSPISITESSITEPGYGPVEKQQAFVDPDRAKTLIESRKEPANIYSPVKNLANNVIPNSTSIVELARALKNNVDLIWEHVFNNIEFIPTYGLQKSGLGALIDGCGNSFDQADAMVQLLRQAGYTADYVFGTLQLNSTQCSALFGTDSNIWSTGNLLSNSGVPNVINWTGTEYLIDFSHVWVRVNIGGSNFIFDPAFKSYQVKSGINLAAAMNYDQASFMTSAKSGATVAPDYVQNINEANIGNNLQSYSINLFNWIKSNKNSADLEDILGGRKLNKVDSSPIRQSAHPHQKPGSTLTYWTSIPNSYKTILSLQYDDPNINISFYSCDIHGKRLTLSFNTAHQAELKLDGILLATSSPQTPGSWNSILLSVTHPYPSTFADGSVWQTVFADGFYLIANAWGNAGEQMKNLHRKKMIDFMATGSAGDSESVLGEGISSTWHIWNAQKCKVSELLNKLTGCMTVFHHQVGLVGINATTFTDLGLINWASSALDNNYDRVKWNDDALAMHGIALEASLQTESVNLGGVSSTPLIAIANSSGKKIFDGKSANWTANVKPNLIGYDAATISNIENWYINNGWRIAIPENANIVKNQWTGYGYFARSPWQGVVGIISGGLKGGSGDENPCGIGVSCTEYQWWKFFKFPPPPTGKSGQGGAGGGGGGGVGGDPVDLRSGAFIYNSADIETGNGKFPYSLIFAKSYNSDAHRETGHLGNGWTHNHFMHAFETSDGLMALGTRQVLDAVAAIAELYVSIDLYKDLSRPHDKFVVTALMNQWFVNQISNNKVVIQEGQSTSEFLKLPNNTYQDRFTSRGSLTKNGDGSFTLTNIDNTIYNFNTAGDISTVVFPFGMTVSYSYTSGKLTSISNGLGRNLNVIWAGPFISSVNDGTGRSVSFTIDAANNLTNMTDVMSKPHLYSYTAENKLWKIYHPTSSTTPFITNTYDSLGRIKEQKDALNNLTSLYLAGSRSEIVNAGGNSEVSYWTQNGYLNRYINGLGKSTAYNIDGLGRRTKVVFPEGNSIEFVFDEKDNILQKRRKAKPGSGLSDIVTSYSYHPLFNSLLTSVDGRGKTTSITYHTTSGRPLSIQKPAIGSPSQNPISSFTWNNKGQQLTETDETGITKKFNYNSLNGNLDSVVQDFGTGRLNLTTQYTYDSQGNVLTITDPKNKTTTYQFNNRRQIVQITSPSPLNSIVKFTYDDDGRMLTTEAETGEATTPWKIESLRYTSTGQVDYLTDAVGDVVDFSYDSSDRIWKKSYPVAPSTYRVWETAYDANNNISTIKDPSGTVTESYTYTDNGLVASLTDIRGNLTQFTYDGLDRLNKTIHPDGSYEQNQSYDENNNVLTLRVRSGNTIVNTYDDLNRLITRSPSGQATESFAYDLAGRMIQAGKPLVAGDPSTGNLQLVYDTAGRLWKEQYPDGKIVQNDFDANGNIIKTIWPDNYFVERDYDELNRLKSIRLNGSTTPAVMISWDKLSRKKTITFDNGVVTTFGRALNNNLLSINHSFSGSNVTFTYNYNKSKQVTSTQISDGPGYMWHPTGSATVAYGTASNIDQYPTIASVAQSYNTSGCLTGDGIWTYSYNTDNQLISAVKTGITVSNKYDALIRIIEHKVGTTSNRYLYSGLERIADYNGSSLQTRYIYGTDTNDLLLSISATGVKTYYHADKNGSIIATSNSSGVVVNKYKYGPFGESLTLSGITHGYTGQKFESATGLYYFRMRHYNPVTGRFLQPDPIGAEGGMNLYAYVKNDPITLIDPLGLKGEIPGSSAVPLQGYVSNDDPDPLLVALNAQVGIMLELARKLYGDATIDYLIVPQSHESNINKALEQIMERYTGGIGIGNGGETTGINIHKNNRNAQVLTVVYIIRYGGKWLKIGETAQKLKTHIRQNIRTLIKRGVLPPGTKIEDVDYKTLAEAASKGEARDIESAMMDALRALHEGFDGLDSQGRLPGSMRTNR